MVNTPAWLTKKLDEAFCFCSSQLQYTDLSTLELFLNEIFFVSDPSDNCFGDKFFNLRKHYVNI